MLISCLFIEFVLFSFLGWVYECIYCAARTGHWDNRGFLYGPVCPIYGLGVTALSLLQRLTTSALSATASSTDASAAAAAAAAAGSSTGASARSFPLWAVFLISMVGSAILEYVTSLVLERRFHARWWDYSHVPLNINGRVCLPASLGFGAAGVVIMRWFLPLISRAEAGISMPPLAAEAVSLLLMAVFAADFALTVDNLMALTAKLDQLSTEFDLRMESAVLKAGLPKQALTARAQEAKESSAALLGRAEELPQAIRSKVGDSAAALRTAAEDSAETIRSRAGESAAALRELAEDAGESASRTLGEITERFRTGASSLSARQRYNLRSMRFAPSDKLSHAADKLKEALSSLQDHSKK